MDRRDFLKKMCIGSLAPSALALILSQQKQTVEAAQIKEPDWVQAELDCLDESVSNGDISIIYMSKQLIDELNNRFKSTACPVLDRDRAISRFAGIPVLYDQMLPMKTEKGDVHVIAARRTTLSEWRNARYHLVAFEQFRELRSLMST